MREYEIRQFKLASGEEIVCEVVQWQNEEELELVVRKVMKLVMGEMETGVRYYSFRPWMVYQENPDDLLILQGNHVVGIAYPPDSLIKQFNEAVDDMEQMYKQRQKEYLQSIGKEEYKTTKQINDLTKSLLDEVDMIEEYLKQLNDSDSSNVLVFDPSKKTLH